MSTIQWRPEINALTVPQSYWIRFVSRNSAGIEDLASDDFGHRTRGSRALLAYAFFELDLHRIQATTRPANRGSWRVMERLGMRREGWLHEAAFSKGVWNDVLIYGILASESEPSASK